MKTYVITVLGAALLSTMASVLSPQKWRAYVRLISALVIMGCVISPITEFKWKNDFKSFNESFQGDVKGEQIRLDMIKKELEDRINKDIESRMKKEFNLNIHSECEISITKDGKVAGVREIHISGNKMTQKARERLCQVYGIEAYEVKNE